MLCPNCEAENRDDAKFCDECGFPLGGAIARAAAASTAGAPQPSRVEDSWFSEPETVSESLAAFDEEPYPSELDLELDAKTESEPSPERPLPESVANPVVSEREVDERETDADSGMTRQLGQADSVQSDEEPGGAAVTQVFEGGEWDIPAEPEQHEQDSFAGFNTWSANESNFELYEDVAPLDATPQAGDAHGAGFTMQMPRVEGAAQPANRDFRISSSSPKRPPKAALVVISAVAAVVIVAVVTFALGLWGGIAVPDVTGMTENDARTVLQDSGFTVRSTQVKSDDTEGLVLVMDPAAGSRAGEGSEVVIHIATARLVPDIVGKSYDEAKSLLEEAGYENVKYEKVKSTDTENVVLSVSPEAGTRVKSGMEVTVDVSEAYRVPDISGMDLSAAQDAITKGGLVPQVVYVDTQEQPEGTILGTTPAANTKVSEGDYVSINVARARGAELVALTEQLFSAGQTATVGGTSIAVDSVGSVSYVGDDTVSFTITGRPFATLMGETVFGSSTTIEGQVVWSDDNEVVSIS